MPVLKVTLHRYNSRAIYRLKKVLGIGKVNKSGSTITYRVRSKALWRSVLVPLFDKFHLRSMKYAAVLIVKKALHLAIDNATPENILELQKSLDRKTDLISPVWNNGTDLKEILDLDWLAGFPKHNCSKDSTEDAASTAGEASTADDGCRNHVQFHADPEARLS